MNIDELIKYMTDTLNRLYMCRSNSSGKVRTNIDNAILYYKKMLIKNDCILTYTENNDVKLDNKSLYNTLLSIAGDIRYFNSLFNEEYLVGVWWYVCLAMNELDIENGKLNGYVREKVRNN